MASNPADACVFCGQKYSAKPSEEHVFPKWLLKLTGDVGREVSIDILGKIIRRRAKRIVFPSCETCNERFGDLEGKAKPVVSDIIQTGVLKSQDARILLDWCDKIRVGAWLAGLMLSKNPLGFIPRFHIQSRIGAKDRLLYIGRAKGSHTRLNWAPLTDFIFMSTPSFYHLCINGLALVSFSSPGLASGPAWGFEYTFTGFNEKGQEQSRLTNHGSPQPFVVPLEQFSLIGEAFNLPPSQTRPTTDYFVPPENKLSERHATCMFFEPGGGMPRLIVEGKNAPREVTIPMAFDNLINMMNCVNLQYLRMRCWVSEQRLIRSMTPDYELRLYANAVQELSAFEKLLDTLKVSNK